MKYTIEGFSQEYATTLKKKIKQKGKEKEIKIDCTDLVILRWFVDFFPNMKKMIIDGKEYAWLTHKKMLNDLPLLDISRRACIERMQKLVEFGILEYKLIKEGGTFSLYGFGKNYENLVQSKKHGSTFEPHRGGGSNDIGGVYGQTHNKDSSFNTDSSFNDKKEIYKESGENEKSNKKQIEEVINLYRSICKSFPQIRSLTDKREKAIKELLKKSSLDEIREGFEKAENTPFLQGQNKDGWRANFDFIIKHEKLIKILEGFYDLNPKPNENKTEEKIYEDNWDEFFREKLGDEYE